MAVFAAADPIGHHAERHRAAWIRAGRAPPVAPAAGGVGGLRRTRQARTFLPPADSNPLAPSSDPAHPTELPRGTTTSRCSRTCFPPSAAAMPPPRPPSSTRDRRRVPRSGRVHAGPVGHAGHPAAVAHRALIEVWATATASSERGPGALRHAVREPRCRGRRHAQHPHGQIYAYPFVPPIPATELAQQRQHLATHGRGLIEMLIEAEERDGRRIIRGSDQVVAFTPAFAATPTRSGIAPRAPRPSLAALSAGERRDLASVLKTVLLKYDRSGSAPSPMSWWCTRPGRRRAAPGSARALRVLPGLPHEGAPQISRGSELGRACSRRTHCRNRPRAELAALDVSREVS